MNTFKKNMNALGILTAGLSIFTLLSAFIVIIMDKLNGGSIAGIFLISVMFAVGSVICFANGDKS